MNNYSGQIDTYLEENLDRYIREIVRICTQPSISSTGLGVRDCAGLVGQILQEHGIESQIYETRGMPIVVGKASGQSDRTLLFYNHYDVQPPEPLELWSTPPFQPHVTSDAIYARGAKDDKGEFISRLAAFDAVREVYGSLPCNVKFLLEGEEESGSPNIAEFVRSHLDLLKADGSIWEEGSVEVGDQPTLLLGVRGVLYIELKVEAMKIDAHSGYAHALPNAAWRLNQALSSMKDRNEKVLIPGFYDRVRKPSKEELQAFDSWPDIEISMQEQFGVDEFLRGVKGNEIRQAVFEPTCNIAGIGSGYQGPGTKTVIPAKAMAKVDFRLVPDQDPEDILEKLRVHLDQNGFKDIQINVLGKMWPFTTPMDDPFVKMTAKAGYEVYGKPTLIGPMSGGSSPIYAVGGPLGIPVVNPGIGYWDNRVHAPNEHIRIKDFLNGARQIARILADF
jgi:acetylornithine deacetylase/succinyl-diaminopimelate desuccinylase-like protein